MRFRDPEVELREAQAKRAALYDKWSRLGLLEGIDDRIVAENTAVLLENVYEYATSKPGRDKIVETGTFSGANAGYDWSRQDGTAVGNDISPYLQYLMPLVRRVYPNLIANDLVGVQPMNAPVGLVFYLKYRYTGLVDNDAVQVDTTTGQGRRFESASAKGQTVPGTEYANFIGNTWSIDPYYSLQTVFRETLDGSSVSVTVSLGQITLTGGNTSVANAAPVVANSAVVQQIILAVNDGATASDTITATLAPSATPNRFVVVSATGADPNTVVAVNGSPTVDVVYNSDGTIQVQPTSGAWTASNNITVSDVAGSGNAASNVTSLSVVVTYDYNMEGNSQLPEIELQVDSYPVQAKTRKLRTKWTIEAQQDLQKMHNVDAEAELTALVSNEIVAEIDREIINDLIVNAAIRVTYDYSNPFIVGGIVNVSAGQTAITGVTSFDDRNKALFYQILEVSNQIYRQSLRGAGNWIVTSPEIAAKLESLLEFKPEPDIQRNQFNLGIVFSGTLNGQFRVYKDPLFPTDLILVGYKGNSFFDAGFFYCPYIPVELTQTIQDPNTFNHVRGVLTRYGKVLVENGARLYGVIRVQNLKAVGADVLPGSNVTTTPHVSTEGLQDNLNATDLI